MGTWHSWKHQVSSWLKHVLTIVLIVIGVALGLFFTFKFVTGLRKKALRKEIAIAKAELDAFSFGQPPPLYQPV